MVSIICWLYGGGLCFWWYVSSIFNLFKQFRDIMMIQAHNTKLLHLWILLSEHTCIMLDCGENSLGQLYKHYGVQVGGRNGDAMLKKVKLVMVSHLHADHHLGVVGLALRRYQVVCASSGHEGKSDTKLIVVAPRALFSWYSSIDCPGIPLLKTIQWVFEGVVGWLMMMLANY